ncbi:hypothetical protein GOODEAATRI_018440 [Goodea atripinnis]|uniref:Uncharacterized protein n=1 Tax=Goodea atripinnis TaxID=208336 RepID=A0ABV0PF41_9TELE
MPLNTGKLSITPDDPRWIGAWWAGFLLCGALLFFSALLMFGFPHSLPAREVDEGAESEQVMLPPALSQEYETPKPSNGVVLIHEPANSPTCCQQLRGMTAIPCACLGIFMGGLLVKKLNLSALGAIRMAMLVNLISTACYISFLFLGCNTGPVAGVTVSYGNE